MKRAPGAWVAALALALAACAASPPAPPRADEPRPRPGATPPAPAPDAVETRPPAPAPLPDEVTLDEVLAWLERHSPRLAAEREHVQAARADLEGARLLPNPTFSYERLRLHRGADTIDGGEDAFLLEQPLPIFGQRGARIASAKRQMARSQAELEAGRSLFAREARVLFTGLLAAQQRLTLLESARADLERVELIVRAEHDAGTRSPYDLLRTQIEGSSLEAELSDARVAVREASAGLAALLGLGDWRPRALGALARPELELDAASLWPELEPRLVLLELARRADEAARAEVELARKERIPTPELRLGLERTRDEFSESFLAGLALPLPIFDRNQGAIGRARAEARAARRHLELARGEARAELERALAQLAERRAALSRFDREVAAALDELRAMAELDYTTGGSGIFELLDSLKAEKELRLAESELLEAAALAEIEARWAAGLYGVAHPAAP